MFERAELSVPGIIKKCGF